MASASAIDTKRELTATFTFVDAATAKIAFTGLGPALSSWPVRHFWSKQHPRCHAALLSPAGTGSSKHELVTSVRICPAHLCMRCARRPFPAVCFRCWRLQSLVGCNSVEGDFLALIACSMKVQCESTSGCTGALRPEVFLSCFLLHCRSMWTTPETRWTSPSRNSSNLADQGLEAVHSAPQMRQPPLVRSPPGDPNKRFRVLKLKWVEVSNGGRTPV